MEGGGGDGRSLLRLGGMKEKVRGGRRYSKVEKEVTLTREVFPEVAEPHRKFLFNKVVAVLRIFFLVYNHIMK